MGITNFAVDCKFYNILDDRFEKIMGKKSYELVDDINLSQAMSQKPTKGRVRATKG